MARRPASGNQLNGDPVSILLETNVWALHNLVDAMEELSDDQLDAEFELGLGTLRKTVTHILAAMRGWADVLRGREQRERLDEGGKVFTVDQLRGLVDEVSAELEEGARAGATSDVVSGSRGGRKYAFTRGGVIAHVTTHGMHHRAQCLNMLRRMGVRQLPASSVLEWMLFGDPTAEMLEMMKEMG